MYKMTPQRLVQLIVPHSVLLSEAIHILNMFVQEAEDGLAEALKTSKTKQTEIEEMHALARNHRLEMPV